jgi:hypothetical protein
MTFAVPVGWNHCDLVKRMAARLRDNVQGAGQLRALAIPRISVEAARGSGNLIAPGRGILRSINGVTSGTYLRQVRLSTRTRVIPCISVRTMRTKNREE